MANKNIDQGGKGDSAVQARVSFTRRSCSLHCTGSLPCVGSLVLFVLALIYTGAIEVGSAVGEMPLVRVAAYNAFPVLCTLMPCAQKVSRSPKS